MKKGTENHGWTQIHTDGAEDEMLRIRVHPCLSAVKLRRYRVTPRRNPSAFRRELLGRIMHHLNRDSTSTVHG